MHPGEREQGIGEITVQILRGLENGAVGRNSKVHANEAQVEHPDAEGQVSP